MQQFQQLWQTQVSDYVTALDWSGDCLAIASAAGEVILQQADQSIVLRPADGQSIDCLAFSHDQRFLAVAGQTAQVTIWEIPTTTPIKTLDYPRYWIDQLTWHPQLHQLAFSLGKQVQLWDVAADQAVAKLDFGGSSVMDLAWQPLGQAVAVGGYRGTKIWRSVDWSAAPQIFDVPSASATIGWSKDGQYFASGNLDRMIMLVETETMQNPWVMRGFPGKIRCLAWSDQQLIAVSSQEGVAVWHYVAASENWSSQVLPHHTDSVQALAFQPGTSLLASTAGETCLWQDGQLVQVLPGESSGTNLAWNHCGQRLAVGMQNGAIAVFGPP